MVYFVIYIMIFKLKYFTVLSCVLTFKIVFQETYLNNKSRCNNQIKSNILQKRCYAVQNFKSIFRH